MQFRVLKSSAGSGKTYNLVRNYLLLVLGKRDLHYFARILAVTFTNKATNEMKERILRTLSDIAEKKEKVSPLVKDLSKELELTEAELSDRASLVLSRIIHQYADFNVSTIDRFVTRIIRTFSFELGLPGALEIELDRDRILTKSIDALFNRMSDDPALEDLLYRFAYDKFTEDKNIRIDNDLFEIASEVIRAGEGRYLSMLRDFNPQGSEKVMKKLIIRMKEIEKLISGKAAVIKEMLDNQGFGSEQLKGGKTGIHSLLSRLASGKMVDISATNRGIAEDRKWYGSKASTQEKAILEGMSAELSANLQELIQVYDAEMEHYKFCEMLRPRLYLIALINEISKQIDEFKKANDIMELDDFNRLIGRLVDESPVPYIYERTGDRFFHYFMDEFQDTSVIQWYNMLPLVENALSEGHESLIVGDVKQAIYRWRGGDAAQMSRLPRLHFPDRDNPDIPLREETLQRAHQEYYLDANWRSSKTVVGFVNAFFKVLMDNHPEELAEAFKGHEQKVMSNDVEGSVEIRFLDESEDDVLRHNSVLESIHAFLDKGYEPSDMAILCRKKAECAEMAQLLIQADIPVLSAESLKLHSSDEVLFLLNWIRFLHLEGRRNEIYLILAYLEKKGQMEARGMQSDEWMRRFDDGHALIDILRSLDYKLSVNELRSMSLQELSIHLSGIFFNTGSADPFVATFIDEIGEFMQRYGNDYTEFFHWWEEVGNDRDVEMPGIGEGVNVMTIHKSKGLEFPVVLLPFMNHKISAGQNHLWVETRGRDKDILPVAWLPVNKGLESTLYREEYEEEMRKSFLDAVNLMYVAFTRAADHLFVLSTNKLSKSNDRAEQNLLWNCYRLSDFKGDESSLIFRMGLVAENVKKEEEPSVSNVIKTESRQSDWRKRIALKYRSDEGLLSQDINKEVEFGNLLHTILSEINVKSDLEAVLNTYVQRGLISIEEKANLKKYILTVIEKEEIAPYFEGGEVYNERTILDQNGTIYRPDRIVLLNGKMVLIDYKTGQILDVHEEQIRNYAAVLKQMKHENISAYLLYFSTGELKKVV